MATNGICSIKVNGVEYPLYFGMLAIEEIANRLSDNPSGNTTKIMTDMVYGGMCNWAHKKDIPFPSYEFVSGLVEDLFDEEDGNEQYIELDRIFRESKHGSKWVQRIEEAKKKMEALTTAEKPKVTRSKRKSTLKT